MPRRINVSPEQVEWLKEAVANGVPFVRMAERVGCCTDTIKRILVRLGLADFDAAKYQLPREAEVELWTRPCTRCGDRTPRPKWQYRCDACHAIEEADPEYGLPDDWL